MVSPGLTWYDKDAHTDQAREEGNLEYPATGTATNI